MQKHQNRIIWMVALINLMMWPTAQVTMAESAFLSRDSASISIDNETSLPIETEFIISGGYRRDDLDWNIAGDTDGNGFIIGAGLNCVLNQYRALNVNFNYQDWSTDNGTSKVYFADGTTAKTQLNEVNWTSYAIMMGLSLPF